MISGESILRPSLQDLRECVSDFRETPAQSAGSVLARMTHSIDEEPLAGFLASVLPAVNFEYWYAAAQMSVSSMAGSGVLDWPIDRAERVAVQVALCRAMVAGETDPLSFAHTFYYAGSKLSDNIRAFASKVLDPMVRDMERLTESRVVPPVLFEAMGRLPASGDIVLDALLADACAKFKDPSPNSRQVGVEKLWDAWERLKSLDNSDDKRASVGMLLDSATSDPAFRSVLETEARALTAVGNNFQIRHFETSRSAISRPEQLDYLFHRLFALLHLLLFNRRRGTG